MNKIRRILFGIAIAICFCSISMIGMLQKASAGSKGFSADQCWPYYSLCGEGQSEEWEYAGRCSEPEHCACQIENDDGSLGKPIGFCPIKPSN